MWLGNPGRAASLEPVLPPGFTHQVIADGLEQPTAMAFAPDGRLFYCEQSGRVRVIKQGLLLEAPFVQVTTANVAEAGLLGIAFDPGFSSNQFLYVYYTVPDPDRHNRVSRFTANGDVALVGSEWTLLDLDGTTHTVHQGGALHFGPDGKLYIGVGEHAGGAESLSNHFGKILRINPDGTIPEDNPFYATTSGTYRSIWAFGLRNPFTFAIQPGTGRMLINDVGASNEEVNEGEAGANYGWPFLDGPAGLPGFKNPLYWYRTTPESCAITGGVFYNPARPLFPATYIGNYFFGDFCGLWIKRLDTNNVVRDFISNAAALGSQSGPIDLDVAADGSLYALLRAVPVGRIVRFGTTSRFLSVRALANGRVQARAVATADQDHVLESSIDLFRWQAVATNSSSNGELEFEVEPSGRQRFYRLRD